MSVPILLPWIVTSLIAEARADHVDADSGAVRDDVVDDLRIGRPPDADGVDRAVRHSNVPVASVPIRLPWTVTLLALNAPASPELDGAHQPRADHVGGPRRAAADRHAVSPNLHVDARCAVAEPRGARGVHAEVVALDDRPVPVGLDQVTVGGRDHVARGGLRASAVTFPLWMLMSSRGSQPPTVDAVGVDTEEIAGDDVVPAVHQESTVRPLKAGRSTHPRSVEPALPGSNATDWV